MLSRKIINIYNDIARKHGNVSVTDFRKYEKQNKLKVDINFLKISKQLGVYLKFLIFKLPNVSNKDTISICKRLLRSAINKCNKELQYVSKELCQSETIKYRLTLKRVRDMITIYSRNRFIQTAFYYRLLQPYQIYNTSSQEIASKIAKYPTEKIVFTDEKLQPTYILS